MMNRGVDRGVPFNLLELKALKDAGNTFVCRYLSRSSWKRLTKSEALKISKTGLYVVVVYQDVNNNVSYFSEEIGIKQAKEALRQAKEIGIPKGATIYFSVDFDAKIGKTIDAVDRYFNGVTKVMEGSGYGVGVYGSYFVVNHVTLKNPKVKFKWQTYAWSGGRVGEYSLYQYRNNVHAVNELGKTIVDNNGNPVVKSVDLNYSNGSAGGWQIKE